jgi:hypothetical protein
MTHVYSPIKIMRIIVTQYWVNERMRVEENNQFLRSIPYTKEDYSHQWRD